MEEKIEDLVVKGVRAGSGSVQREIPSSSSPTIVLSGYSRVSGQLFTILQLYFQQDDSVCTYEENVDGSKVSMGINSFVVMVRLVDLDAEELLKGNQVEETWRI